MEQLRSWFALAVFVSLVSCAGAGGERAHELVLRDVAGAEHRVFPVDEPRTTVLLFVATECPISNYFAPEVERIRAAYEPEGVAFRLVYVDADDEPDEIRAHLADYGYRMPALVDFGGALVAHTGATVTPEAVVLAPGGEVLYRGRIDDTYVAYGTQRAEPTRRDLRLALDDVLAGRAVEVARTEAVGCFIPEPTVEAVASCCAE